MQDESARYFQADAHNIRVGGTLRITGRGLGVVESILNSNHDLVTEASLQVHISDVLRVCLRFQDEVIGYRLLSPTDRLPLKGYGTYMPGGKGIETVWRTLI